MRSKLEYILVLLLFAGGLFSCKKESSDPEPFVPGGSPSKWEVIPGNYKIYDTVGNYLYDMTVSHWGTEMSNGTRKDTFLFEGIDGQFNFKNVQSDANITNWPRYYFYLGHHQPLYDTNNDRWKLFGYGAHYSNDSIYFKYKLENILYYIEDIHPYELRNEKRIGIKQH